MFDRRLAADFLYRLYGKDYVFACQAIHISVAEAKEKELTDSTWSRTVGGR
jgi:hypothetical protein